MAEADDLRRDLRAARRVVAFAGEQLAASRERLARIAGAETRLARVFDAESEEHSKERERLRSARAREQERARRSSDLREQGIALERETSDRFAPFTDPLKGIERLSDRIPILLMPVRLETRFKTISFQGQERHQLWVRVYPDDCWIDTFDPTLTDTEVVNARAYWIRIWQAGGVEEEERTAWAALVGSHGSGRASWIVGEFRPTNLAAKPAKPHREDVILTIPIDQPVAAAEEAPALAFWRAAWLADGDAALTAAARTKLEKAVGEARAAEIAEKLQPVNFGTSPAGGVPKDAVNSSAAFLVLPPVETRQSAWSGAPKMNILPDRFVFIGDDGSDTPVVRVGNPVPSPLLAGPDPTAPKENQLHEDENGNLVVPPELLWLSDFDRAVEVGMGFRIALTPVQARAGFRRILVVGLRLSADANDAKTDLETLFQHHGWGRTGFSLVTQGTPTNNTEAVGSGQSREDDPDASFDDRRAPLFTSESSWMDKRDGQWLAEYLGIDPASLAHVHNAGATDQRCARAMHTALWPATLGYWMESMMSPVFTPAAIDQTRRFFCNYVVGAGGIPAIRIGSQPYGVLPATAISQMGWLDQRLVDNDDDVFFGGLSMSYLRRLYALLQAIRKDWRVKEADLSFVGKAGDPHRILLDILGLHSGSVEWSQRYAESLQTLYNRLNLQGLAGFFEAIAIASKRMAASGLLTKLGYAGDRPPDILDKIFHGAHPRLKGGVVDDRPLSETERVRAYTPDGRNYLQWAIDAANTSLDALYKQDGFTDDKPPAALLYVLLRHALQLGYDDVSTRLYLLAGLMTAEQATLAKVDQPFLHVAVTDAPSESRYARLYAAQPVITGSQTQVVGNYIGARLSTIPVARDLRRQIDALERLKQEPTARLERSFADHVDCCAYRLDAWLLGLVSYQLAAMRNVQSRGGVEVRSGIYLGAYGWLEDLRPEHKVLTPVELNDPALIEDFAGDPPLVRDSTNQGYVHAPSLNHAVAAAVLRNGYISNASPANRQSMAVNLTSERARLALALLQGIRAGQSLADLLGYQLERGLHDRHALAEVDKFIYKLRKAFPLRADRMQSTRTAEGVPIESIEARNVVDGLSLVEHVKSTGKKTYPFGKETVLPHASGPEADAINAEVDRLLEAHDAVADLALAEGVYQAVVGNYERVASTYDAYARGKFPPEPDIIRTPFEGIGLTHRVALHLDPAASHAVSPIGGIGMTPRAKGEPAVNKWLTTVLPAPSDVGCVVTFRRASTGAEATGEVTLDRLGLQPADLLVLVREDDRQAMTELDDRVLRVVFDSLGARPDTRVALEYTRTLAAPFSVFELMPLVRSARRLTSQSRALKPTDLTLMNEADSKQDAVSVGQKSRLEAVRADLQALRNDLAAFQASLEGPLADLDNRRDEILSDVDDYVSGLVPLLARAATFGIVQAGWGFAYDFKRDTYAAIVKVAVGVVKRWNERLAIFQTLIGQYAALPPEAPDADRFALLQRAESMVSTTLTAPLPAHATFRATLENVKRPAFEAARDEFVAIVESTETAVSGILSDLADLVPPDDFDRLEIDLTPQEDAMVRFTEDAVRVLSTVKQEVDRRLAASQTILAGYDNLAAADEKLAALEQAARVLLGDDFRIVPCFDLTGDQGDELQNALTASRSGTLFQFLTAPADPDTRDDFPVDTWLYGVARVREKMRTWEQVMMLAGSLGRPEPQLEAMQLPFKPGDRWLGLEFPPEAALDTDRLLYAASFSVPFDKTVPQCGLLLDEWTETIPRETIETGITFHHDRPNTEAPQAMLLVTPSTFKGAWRWAELVGALNETLDFARFRAIEPTHIDELPYAAFLPATVMASQFLQLTIAANLAFSNQIVLTPREG